MGSGEIASSLTDIQVSMRICGYAGNRDITLGFFSGFQKHTHPLSTDHDLTTQAPGSQGMTLHRQMMAGIAIIWPILVDMLMINAWQGWSVMYAEREARSAVNRAENLVKHLSDAGQARVRRGELTEGAARQQVLDEFVSCV